MSTAPRVVEGVVGAAVIDPGMLLAARRRPLSAPYAAPRRRRRGTPAPRVPLTIGKTAINTMILAIITNGCENQIPIPDCRPRRRIGETRMTPIPIPCCLNHSQLQLNSIQDHTDIHNTITSSGHTIVIIRRSTRV